MHPAVNLTNILIRKMKNKMDFEIKIVISREHVRCLSFTDFILKNIL